MSTSNTTVDYSVINQGRYPVKPMFRSKLEKLMLIGMTAVDIAVVSYWMAYLTYNG